MARSRAGQRLTRLAAAVLQAGPRPPPGHELDLRLGGWLIEGDKRTIAPARAGPDAEEAVAPGSTAAVGEQRGQATAPDAATIRLRGAPQKRRQRGP
jgi:hypothetical protein